MKEKKLLKKLFSLFLAILISLSVSPLAIAKNSGEKEVIQLKLAHAHPPFLPLAGAVRKWTGMITEESQGRVKFDLYFSSSLLNANEIFRGVQKGIADIAFYVMGHDWGYAPLNMFPIFLTGVPDMKAATEIHHAIWNKFPELSAEWEAIGLKVLTKRMMAPHNFHFVGKKEIRLPSDMKGIKMIPFSQPMAEKLVALGAAPVDVKLDDTYMSLERGVVNGIVGNFALLSVFGLDKLVTNHTLFPGSVAVLPEVFLMNLDTWNSLPADIQKIFMDLAPWLEQENLRIDSADEERAINQAKEKGDIFVKITPEEMRQWDDKIKPVQEKWIAENEANGKPAKAIYEEMERLREEYRKDR